MKSLSGKFAVCCAALAVAAAPTVEIGQLNLSNHQNSPVVNQEANVSTWEPVAIPWLCFTIFGC